MPQWHLLWKFTVESAIQSEYFHLAYRFVFTQCRTRCEERRLPTLDSLRLLREDDLFSDNLLCTSSDVIHFTDPHHLVTALQLLG